MTLITGAMQNVIEQLVQLHQENPLHPNSVAIYTMKLFAAERNWRLVFYTLYQAGLTRDKITEGIKGKKKKQLAQLYYDIIAQELPNSIDQQK